jgi:hypothetical protein
MDLPTVVGKLLARQDGDVLREGVRVLVQALMETEVTGLVGAIPLGQDDEWEVAERRYFSAESMKRLLTPVLAAGEQEF